MPEPDDIRDRIHELESLEGEGTELVTVSVPPDKSIGSVRDRIAREHASAGNIRTDRTRERVQRALERLQRTLRRYEETPDDGVVAYAGVVDGDLVSYVFDELPAPVSRSTYRCDDRFDPAPLLDAVSPRETHGLVVVERGRAAVGRLLGERVVPIQSFESQVMGKTRAGGQSARRFERERERQTHEFFGEVGRIADAAFLDGDDGVASLAIGGTLATAKQFATGGYLDPRLRDRVVGTYPVEYANVRGLHQLVERAADRLLDAERRETRERLDEFFSRLRDGETVAYGPANVEQALEFGAVETALVASSVPRTRREELERAASRQGGNLVVVSVDSERGSRFADAFDGVGALLRFAVN